MSFLEKLKKGMAEGTSIELPQPPAPAAPEPADGEAEPNVAATFAAVKAPAKSRIKTLENLDEESADRGMLYPGPAPLEDLSAKTSRKKTPAAKTAAPAEESKWLETEGQLAVNVFQTENDLVIQAAIAGIRAEDLDIQIEDEVINLKGKRENPLKEAGDYFIEECYWGPFSRKIILPVEVDSSQADASMKEGVLTIRLPKIIREKKKRLVVK